MTWESPSAPPPAELLRLVRVANGLFVTNRELVASACAAARQNGAAVLSTHPFAKSVGLGALAIIRLKCAFRHDCFRLASVGVAPNAVGGGALLPSLKV
jgi:hypothetical protein